MVAAASRDFGRPGSGGAWHGDNAAAGVSRLGHLCWRRRPTADRVERVVRWWHPVGEVAAEMITGRPMADVPGAGT